MKNHPDTLAIYKLSRGLYELLPSGCQEVKGSAVDTALERIRVLQLQVKAMAGERDGEREIAVGWEKKCEVLELQVNEHRLALKLAWAYIEMMRGQGSGMCCDKPHAECLHVKFAIKAENAGAKLLGHGEARENYDWRSEVSEKRVGE